MAETQPDFGFSVFINCPFDDTYKPLLRALLFTIVDCGLSPRIATEEADSGAVRVEKIRHLIGACRYSVHDLSRIEPLKAEDLPRFNMPFELGLDLGCRYYGPDPLASKQCLILEREPYRYQRVLSDIAGSDIRAHRNDPETLVAEVRKWLRVTTSRPLRSGSRIWERFNEFTSYLQISLKESGFTQQEIDSLEVAELIHFARNWIEATQ